MIHHSDPFSFGPLALMCQHQKFKVKHHYLTGFVIVQPYFAMPLAFGSGTFLCYITVIKARFYGASAFEKKLQSIFYVPSRLLPLIQRQRPLIQPACFGADDVSNIHGADSDKQAPGQEHQQSTCNANDFQNESNAHLRQSKIHLLLIKASQASTTPCKRSVITNQSNACFSFNLRQSCAARTKHVMLHYTGKTHFEKNFINSFYTNDPALLIQLSKPTGAGIDVLNYESAHLSCSRALACRRSGHCSKGHACFAACFSEAAADVSNIQGACFPELTSAATSEKKLGAPSEKRAANGSERQTMFGRSSRPCFEKITHLKLNISKAQLSSLVAQVILNHELFVQAKKQINGRLTKNTVLETMQLMHGAFIMYHGNIWFISANELTQCCLIYCNSPKPYLQINATDVGILACLNKGPSQCVAVCNHLFKQLRVILSIRNHLIQKHATFVAALT